LLRIGVNALYLIPGSVGGTEIYLRNLLQGLAGIDGENQYVIFTNRETSSDLAPKSPNFICAQQPIHASFRPARILWEQTGLPFAARKHQLDVLFNPGFTCPILCPCPNVTVFHDLQHKRHPEYFRWFDLPFWQLLLWASARRSKRLISVSAATRDDLGQFYGVDSTVIHHGVEPAFFEIARKREPQDFLLCVSTLHPHKNLERLLRAHTQNMSPLIITGFRGFAAQRLEKLAGPGVRFTGWIPRTDLYELFRTARGFIYPSTFEGFGMPVLEAMAAGVPAACADIPPLREIADGCALFFNPQNESELTAALCLLTIKKAPATEAGQKRAAEFTWEKAARATLECLTAAIDSSQTRD
jgi:glycosyltransferase involved in cell wall biosynthesis